jgi:chromosome segregation ATPase
MHKNEIRFNEQLENDKLVLQREKEAEAEKFLRLLAADKETRTELQHNANDLREALRQRDSEAEELRAKSQMLAQELDNFVTRARAESAAEIDRLRSQLAQKDEEVTRFGEQMAKMTTNMETGLAQMRQQLDSSLQAQQFVVELQSRASEKDRQLLQLTKESRAKDDEIAALREALNSRTAQLT